MSLIQSIDTLTQGDKTYLEVKFESTQKIVNSNKIFERGELEEVNALYFQAPSLDMSLDAINKAIINIQQKAQDANLKKIGLMPQSVLDEIKNTLTKDESKQTPENWMEGLLQSCSAIPEDYAMLLDTTWNVIKENSRTDNGLAQPNNYENANLKPLAWQTAGLSSLYYELSSKAAKQYLIFFSKHLKSVWTLMSL